MATKKQATNSTKATSKAAAAVPARVAKPRTPRVSAPRVTKTKHSKADAAVEAVAEIAAKADPREAIAKLAYGYWAARGFQGGDPVEDWVRAEKEYLQSK
jgi:hypothetical protein